MTFIVAVLHQKGGSGKTTLAVNLAAAAHLEGLSTLLLDMDVQGSALDWSATRPEGSRLSGLAVVKADKALKPARLAEITRGREVVIIDGPARQRDVTASAALVADVVLVPITPGPFDFWAASETLSTLDYADELREQLGRDKARRVFVVNRATTGTLLARAAQQEIEKSGAICAGVVRQRVAFGERAARGESVFGCYAAKDAAEEIAHLWGALKGSHGRKQSQKRSAAATAEESGAAIVDLAEAKTRRAARKG